MKIVKLDVKDGKGEIEISVSDDVTARRLEEFLKFALDACNERDEVLELLIEIGNFAHDHSKGPAVPDALWEVRRMAYQE
jgi:hypothetical protein